MTARIMRLLLLFSGLVLSLSLAAQYPSNPAKSRLGYQTTGDGLTYRGSGAPSFSPGTIMNAWMYLDTTNMILYGYKNFTWIRLPLANNGITMSGAYAQLGGSLIQNTTVESGTYDYKVGKTSGTNYAYHNIFGSGVYAGGYSKYGDIETDYSLGGGSYALTSIDTDDSHTFSLYPTGFDFTYIGNSGVSQLKIDSSDFTIIGLDSYSSHSTANAAKSDNKLYLLNDSRHVYIKSGTGSADILGSGTTNRIPIWTASNTLGSSNALYNSTTKRWTWDSPSVLELPMGTDAQRPSPATTSDFWYNTTGNGLEWYNGTRWAKVVESTINTGTNARIPFFNSNGQLTESSTFTQSSNKLTLGVATGKNPMVDIVTGTGDGTFNEAAGLRLRNNSTDGNTFIMQFGTSTVAKGGSNQGHAYIQSGLWGGSYDNPLLIQPKGGKTAFGQATNIFWDLTVYSRLGMVSSVLGNNNAIGGGIVFNSGTGNSGASGIYQVFDKSQWYQGQGLTFRTQSGADISGGSNQGLERMRISSDGLIGIGEINPQRLLHVTGEARITDLTTDTPTRIVGADADGDLGAITVSTGLSLSSGVLTATGASTWLKPELEAGRDVTIAGAASTDFRIQTTRNQFDGKTKIGSDSSFVHDPSVDTTKILGSILFGKPSSFGSPSTSGYQFIFRSPTASSTYMLIESGRTSPTGGEASLELRPSGIWGATIGYGTTTSKSLQFYNYNNSRTVMFLGSSGFVSGNSRTVIVGGSDDPIQWGNNGGLVVFDTITSGKALFLAKKVASSSTPIAMFSSSSSDRFTFDDDGATRFHTYGQGAKEAADLSKTESVYTAIYATDGTILEKQANAEQYNTVTSTTSPQTLSSTRADNLINQGSTQSTFTLNLPASPVDGQVCMITYNNAITTLTIDGNGNTIVGSAVTTAVAGSQRKFKFYSGIGWIKQY